MNGARSGRYYLLNGEQLQQGNIAGSGACESQLTAEHNDEETAGSLGDISTCGPRDETAT
jgi:hypothetical protein